MALTKIITDGITDDAVTSGKIPANAVGTSEIADQAVTLAKLPHGDGSSDGKFLRANNGADPSFETVTSTTINNNADNKVITGSDTANTLEAESNVHINGGRLLVGTSTPAPYSTRLLTVGSTSFDDTALEIRSSSSTGRLYFTDSSSSGVGAYQGELTYEHLNGANRMHTKIGGTTKISVTTDGLTFNGDTAAANALDDYEEGTWTPTFDTNAGTNTSGNCKYIKIGHIVHCFFRATHPTTSSSSYATITGLPFTNHGFAVGVPGGAFSETNAGENLSMIVNPSQTFAYILKCDNSGVAVVTQSSISGKDFRGCITYFTT